jgi:hypothetical protein
MRPHSLQGDASMFDFAKRDLVLWLAALAIAAALMALTANFAIDRFSAGYSEQLRGTKAGIPVR